jgi:hypothetical protein
MMPCIVLTMEPLYNIVIFKISLMLLGIFCSASDEEIEMQVFFIIIYATFLTRRPVFWDITPCSPLKISRRFGVTCRFRLQARRINQARYQHEAGVASRTLVAIPASCMLYLALLILRPRSWRRHVLPKHRLTFNGQHGVMCQKTGLFSTTAVRTSNPTFFIFSKCRLISFEWRQYCALLLK